LHGHNQFDAESSVLSCVISHSDMAAHNKAIKPEAVH
jgi:hypothetical protein